MKKLNAIIGAGLIIIVVLLVPTLSVRQALAATPTIQATQGAFAYWPDAQIRVGELTLTNIQLNVGISGDRLQGEKQTVILLHFDTQTCLSCLAQLTTTKDVFRVNGLSSATLSPVTLDFCVDFDCTQTAQITIQANWKGFGSVDQDHLTAHGHGFNLVFTGTNREATATGSLNGQSLGQTTDAQILNRNFISNVH